MEPLKDLKKELFRICLEKANQRVANAREKLDSIEESRDEEVKNSAGDKFETGRAMMQMEAENLQVQLNEAAALRMALLRIDPARSFDRVQTGSLILTNKGNYFISVGIGKVLVEGKAYYSISGQAPIAQAMWGKAAKEEFQFNNQDFKILQIQ